MGERRQRFEGWIAGVGTDSGTRLVLGHWERSPFGAFSDVMVEGADGRRTLLAPTGEVAAHVAATYRFEDVRVVPVRVSVDGAEWRVTAGSLALGFAVGRRPLLGTLLRAVPVRLARRPAWAALLDTPARLLPGVRTRGSAGGGRREWYGAHDLRRITSARATWQDRELGRLTPVEPPVSFGFGSTPRRPALVRVTTTVETERRK
ncbi:MULTISPECIES: hypothetical protein [Streptomyces]|uniref:Uncharacterized protein n=2 Tax=Streptomyces diastaticus group TaxID=2849069 RepID=A0ABQ1CSY9_STRDI|nr:MULTISPECIES: hypothetical protein [Streptomyces]NEE45729.1 hypothetical protein [Streptomyces sp. SID8455]MDQ0292416.1 hypothetical protein [Streptomyces sp. DSM 41037]PJM84030.1 hypothetical protein CH313_08735 [Streptomyces sp. TSRI0384-2]QNE84128.1 hypothetical protein F0345_25960 [Streptomyces rutgersensis]GFH68739.1 hypothetical protein Srut_52530 [Streptomyces rutgersensis]